MLTFDALCEQRIAEAMQRGDFDALPGMGKPLVLEDDPLVPEEIRVANRIMKNAGFVPAEIGLRREIAVLRSQLALLGDEARSLAVRRLCLLMEQLSGARGEVVNLTLETAYWERLKEKAA